MFALHFTFSFSLSVRGTHLEPVLSDYGVFAAGVGKNPYGTHVHSLGAVVIYAADPPYGKLLHIQSVGSGGSFHVI